MGKDDEVVHRIGITDPSVKGGVGHFTATRPDSGSGSGGSLAGVGSSVRGDGELR